ncbi:MAG: glycosyltransferase family 2 protein [Oligoflexia bacterium]|nr:glycosyltransferase family 2 protein [Oligoflexia bacterium]
MEKMPILGIVVPAFNEEVVINTSAKRLFEKMQQMMAAQIISEQSFILFIDDGSSDNTWKYIQHLCNKSQDKPQDKILANFFKGIKLSKNFGHQNALLSGLHYLTDKVDVVISIDVDLQQDIGAMDEFIQQYQLGCDIVYGVRHHRESDSSFKKFTALSFYTLMKWCGINVIKNHADYRLLSNKVLRTLKNFKEHNLFLRGLLANIGFKHSTVYHHVYKRELGSSKYSLKKMLALAIDGITSFTVAPVRFITMVGGLIFVFSFFMIGYILLMTFNGHVVPGWASTVIPIYFIGGIQLISLGVVGEYIGKIYMETKARPAYIIEEIS